jgi:hypothetical protein
VRWRDTLRSHCYIRGSRCTLRLYRCLFLDSMIAFARVVTAAIAVKGCGRGCPAYWGCLVHDAALPESLLLYWLPIVNPYSFNSAQHVFAHLKSMCQSSAATFVQTCRVSPPALTVVIALLPASGDLVMVWLPAL